MKIIKSPDRLRAYLPSLHETGRIALVPTMGCLHQGHLKLVDVAKKHADFVVVSIYVNPTQFGPAEDFTKYPRTPDQDISLCRDAGVDVLFMPERLYADDGPLVSLRVTELSNCLCGRSRPHHFNGVVTVVAILFNLVQPDVAVFGEKDYQQLVIIRRMVTDLSFPVEVIGVPTVRETDGLALSSRNTYLDERERMIAGSLYRSLKKINEDIRAGERDIPQLVERARSRLAANGIEPEYLEIREAETLKTLGTLGAKPARAFIAARIGKARLIDNIPLEQP